MNCDASFGIHQRPSFASTADFALRPDSSHGVRTYPLSLGSGQSACLRKPATQSLKLSLMCGALVLNTFLWRTLTFQGVCRDAAVTQSSGGEKRIQTDDGCRNLPE